MNILEIKYDTPLYYRFTELYFARTIRNEDWISFIKRLDKNILDVELNDDNRLVGHSSIKFEKESDMTMFLLRWS